MAGWCSRIDVTIQEGQGQGRGQRARHSCGYPSQTGVSALETVMTILHAGAKSAARHTGCPVGFMVWSFCVNALSSYMKVVSEREGCATSRNTSVAFRKPLSSLTARHKGNGTITEFIPDKSIFGDWNTILIMWLRGCATSLPPNECADRHTR